MSDDYTYLPEGAMSDEELEESFEAKLRNITEDQFLIFYSSLLQKLGTSRHSSPMFQVWSVLSVDRYVLIKIYEEVERMNKP